MCHASWTAFTLGAAPIPCRHRGGSGGRHGSASDGFKIGGATFDEEAHPLLTGVQGVRVELIDANGNLVDSTTTKVMGLWEIDNVQEGSYTVIFRAGSDQSSIGIVVDADHKAANQSIRLLGAGAASLSAGIGVVPRAGSAR